MSTRLATAAAAVALCAAALPASAQQGIEAGRLECVIEGGTGFIVGSSKDLACTFDPVGSEFAPEPYFGVVNKYGLDVGTTGATFMQWIVLAPSADVYAPGSLAGNYVGASAGASVGVGAGANLLVGGSGSSFTLQPLSVETQTGVNIAVGVTDFQLRSASN